MKKILFLIAVLALVLCSCKDSHDYTPATLYITEDAFDDCFNVSKFNAEHETSFDGEQLRTMGQHKFTHVYVAYGGKALGVWELPCEVPILDVPEADSLEVTITPCFKKNGQSSTIKGYGYITSYKVKTKLKKGVITYITEETMHKFYEYHKYTEFKLVETFMQNSFEPFNPMTSLSNFVSIPDPDMSSNRIGVITLTEDTLFSTFEVASQLMRFDVYALTYMEIRYKCDNDLNIEIYAPNYSNVYACGGLFATDEWQTVYINLDERLGNIYSMGAYFYGNIDAKIIFSGDRLEDQDTHYYIDYVKIVTGPQP